MFNMCDKITPDVIHIQHEYGLYGSSKGIQIVEFILRCKLADVPVVTTLHTVYDELKDFEKVILRTIVGESSAIIVHEDYQKETLVKCFGQKEKIRVIPHGARQVDVVPQAKQKLGIEGKKVILLCGSHRSQKAPSAKRGIYSLIAPGGSHRVCEVDGKVVELYVGATPRGRPSPTLPLQSGGRKPVPSNHQGAGSASDRV